MRKIHIEIDIETEEYQTIEMLKQQIKSKIISIFFFSYDIKKLEVEEK